MEWDCFMTDIETLEYQKIGVSFSFFFGFFFQFYFVNPTIIIVLNLMSYMLNDNDNPCRSRQVSFPIFSNF